MANEITVAASLSFSKGGKTASLSLSPTRFDMTGGDYSEGTLTASSTEAAFALPGTNTEGMLLIKNLSTDTDILVGPTGAQNIVVPFGGVALFKCGASAVYYKTSSGTAEFNFLLLEA